MVALPLTRSRSVSVSTILDTTWAILSRRYVPMLLPFLLVGGAVTAVLMLGGLVVPAESVLLVPALLIAVIGIVVSFTAASVASYRIAGAVLFGDAETHVNGQPVGDTFEEVEAAHGRIVPMLGLLMTYMLMGGIVIGAFFLLFRLMPGFGALMILLLTLPPIWFMTIRLSLAGPVVIMGEDNPFAALDRSWSITKGHVFTMFLISLIFGALNGMLGMASPIVGAFLGEGVEAAMDIAQFVLWLPVGPATTMAMWGLMRA